MWQTAKGRIKTLKKRYIPFAVTQGTVFRSVGKPGGDRDQSVEVDLVCYSLPPFSLLTEGCFFSEVGARMQRTSGQQCGGGGVGQEMWSASCYHLSFPALFSLFVVGFSWALWSIAANPSTYSLDDYICFCGFKYCSNQVFITRVQN